MRIVTTPYRELPAAQRAHLEAIAEAEFGQHPLLGSTIWAEPDWSFRVFEGESLAAFHNIVLRTVRVDGAPLRVAGLNNVITLREFRGRGIGAGMLRETQPRWFTEFGAEGGLLLCAESLVPFYAALGWEPVSARVSYEQPAGHCIWAASCMALDPGRRAASAREVDLAGLPW